MGRKREIAFRYAVKTGDGASVADIQAAESVLARFVARAYLDDRPELLGPNARGGDSDDEASPRSQSAAGEPPVETGLRQLADQNQEVKQ